MVHRAVLIMVLGLAFSGATNATTFFGNTIRATHEYTGVGVLSGPVDAVVDANVEVPTLLFYSVDLSDTTIFIDYAQFGGPPSAYDPVAFNGTHIFDLLGAIPDFYNVTLNTTNISGLDASRITFDGDNIFVNFAGLTISSTSTVLLDIEPVPEPLPIALTGLGLATLFLQRRSSRARHS